MCDALTDQAQELLGQDLGIQAGECEEAAGEVASFATSQGQQAPSTRSGTMQTARVRCVASEQEGAGGCEGCGGGLAWWAS